MGIEFQFCKMDNFCTLKYSGNVLNTTELYT